MPSTLARRTTGLQVTEAQQIGKESGTEMDKCRFRANIYLDLASGEGYGEQKFVGRSLKIGAKAVVSILERDPRCKMITLDPDTCESNPEVLRAVAQKHESTAGVYAAVLVEGMVRSGDTVQLLE